MTSLRLALLPVLLLSSCEKKEIQSSDTGSSGTDTDNSPTSIQVAGDVEISQLTELCASYDVVEVSGSATLNTDTATDLTDVSCLTSLTGSLVIQGENLETIELPDLHNVGDDLVIEGLNSLTELSMNSLEIVGGSLLVSNNPYLQVANWDVICDIGTSIVIRENANLQVLNLATLERVQTTLANGRPTGNTEYTVDISENPELEILDLGEIKTMDTALIISNNASLTQILVGDTTMVGGELKIIDNSALNTIDFELLNHVGGALTLSNNVDLMSHEDNFASLRSLEGGLTLHQLPQYNVPQFPQLSDVAGSIHIDDVGQQTDASINLSHLTHLDGELIINQFAGKKVELQTLQSTTNSVTFSNNANLVAFDIPDGITWGGLKLINNAAMLDLNQFANIGSLTGMLEIRNNASLQSVAQLEGIGSIAPSTFQEDTYTCEMDIPDVLICGSPQITYEKSCELLAGLYQTGARSGGAYLYEGNECPDECPDIGHHCDTMCVGDNLDDDGDGYSENEGDCDDTDPSIHPGVYPYSECGVETAPD